MKSLKTVILGFVAGILGAYIFHTIFTKQEAEVSPFEASYNNSSYNTSSTSVSPNSNTNSLADAVDFSVAASKAIPSVVYINSISQGASYSYWDLLFGGGSSNQTRISSGSGVIFSQDGYIVTNNHVVETAERIEVNYNKRVYPAELIGTDPSTDLAVIKINETSLPAIALGNSSNLQVGEWVVAVGNPFSLSSTVTAGIVSAKGRRIGILEDKFPIESFIQTDAAINPGNSGGALVNKNGELVGINTAILSKTGSYTGYAFAVPVDIAKKVADDLIKYGIVQKAYFGGNVVEYDFQNAKKYGLDTNVKNYNGVLLERLEENGAAIEAGLKLKDIIVKINNADINSKSAFEEELSNRYPGEKINVTYVRDGKTQTTSLTLRNRNGEPELTKRKIFSSTVLGAQLEQTEYGVKVFKLKEGYLKNLGVPENYTIISINRIRISKPEEVIEFFENYKGRVAMYGMNSSKQAIPYNFILR